MPRVDFHTHSSCSDGALDPERLAAYLASRGAQYAALTDHDTNAGSTAFRAALARRGVGCVDGVEFTARSPFGELHILAYSAGPIRPELAALLPPHTGGRWGAGLAGMGASKERDDAANTHRPGIPAATRGPSVPWASDLIAGIHGCGAASYLAHPFTVSRDPVMLGRLLDELEPAGLDGIEAIYGAYTEAERAMLLELASSRSLAVSAGSDIHEPGSAGPEGVVEMDDAQWRAFRDSISGRPEQETGSNAGLKSEDGSKQAPDTGFVGLPGKRMRPGPQNRGASAAIRVAIPALAVITLFVVSMFAIVIPQVRGMLLEHKKETIQGIAESVVSILAEYERDVRAGRMDLESAQREATARVRDIRYGPLKKDYLWITDTLPRMVMHPYRQELDGQDLREFRDARGLPVFVEFVRASSATGEGYVEYLWQWEDEEDNIVPKLSYVTRFAAWDWILGTGVYLDDVNAEISSLTNRIVLVASGVSAILAVLLAFMVQQGLAAERARQSAESEVRESREQYRVLVEASREGMAIIMDGAFTFANPALLHMTGYSEHEFLLLSVDDVFIPFPDGTEESAAFIRSLVPGQPLADSLPAPFSCSLAHKIATRLSAMVSATGFGQSGHEGVMLAIREEGAESGSGSLDEKFTGNVRFEAIAREAAADSAARRLSAMEPVSSIAVMPVVCGPGLSIREAAAAMTRMDTGVAFVVDDAGRTLGAVSERALSRRVVAGGVDPQLPLFRVMDAPLNLIDESASLSAARNALHDSGSDWLALENSDGSVTRIIKSTSLDKLLDDDLSASLARIGRASSVEELVSSRAAILDHARAMDAAGGKARFIVRLLTEAHDNTVRKLVDLGLPRLGEAPCPWAFVALGSAGRGEMLPGSDQDNAIVFDPPSGDGEAERPWFLAMGEYLCGSLERIGIPKCKHGLMARNPDWCASRAQWEERYAHWVGEPESERIVNLNALLDIRPVAGDAELVDSIRSSFESAVARTPSFLLHLANGARNLRIPGAPIADPAGAKEAAGLFPAFVRVYATKTGLRQTNTFTRLDALAEKGILWADTAHESSDSYEVLLKNRLGLGLEASGAPGRIADAMTKAALSQASVLQKRIGFDFLGMSG